MKTIVKIIAFALLLASCEKVVTLDLSNNVDKLVVEGNITNLPGPYFVKLTKSVNFNNDSTFPVVANAVVTVYDNTGQTETLTYLSNGVYKTNTLVGIEGRTYYLNITVDGKNYTAESTMPAEVTLDNLTVKESQFANKKVLNILPNYNDPIAFGNNYRLIQNINSKLDKTYYAYNDNLNNGLPNQRPLRSSDQDLELKTGDIVTIEMQCISNSAYNYFYSLGQQAGADFGGGSAPANPPNNITGNALGIFSAHTTQTRTVVIP
jgi:Domain of unknown function (DUF4249)